jgi:hypothetical protein
MNNRIRGAPACRLNNTLRRKSDREPRRGDGAVLIFSSAWGMVMVNAIAGGRGSQPKRPSRRGNVKRKRRLLKTWRGFVCFGVHSDGFLQWLRWPMLITGETDGYDARREGAGHPAFPHSSFYWH